MRFESIHYWYWEHWKFFRNEVKTSIIQGIAVFLSLFETDPDVRRVFRLRSSTQDNPVPKIPRAACCHRSTT